MMDFKLLVILVWVSVNAVLADYGDLRLVGGDQSNYGRLEYQQSDGRWGTVCDAGFDSNAVKVACRQLGHDRGELISRFNINDDTWLPVAVCNPRCYGTERRLRECIRPYSCSSYCSHANDVYIHCQSSGETYYDYDDDDGQETKSSGAVVVSAILVVVVFVIVVLMLACLMYMRRSFIRRQNNQAYVVTQQRRPRILVARVTCSTARGPPPPPPYTPTQPTSDYTPVPPRSYQPVATDDYTTTPSSDVPSEPPPEYTPSVSTDDVPMLTVQ